MSYDTACAGIRNYNHTKNVEESSYYKSIRCCQNIYTVPRPAGLRGYGKWQDIESKDCRHKNMRVRSTSNRFKIVFYAWRSSYMVGQDIFYGFPASRKKRARIKTLMGTWTRIKMKMKMSTCKLRWNTQRLKTKKEVCNVKIMRVNYLS